MAIKVMADSGGTIFYNAQDIGAAFATFASGSDYVIEGIGNELTIAHSADSLTVTIGTGEAIVCGRPVMVSEKETLELPSNNTEGVYIVLRVDLGRGPGNRGFFTYAKEDQLKSENLNNGYSIHDLILGFAQTTASGVGTFSDQRNITASNGGGSRFRVTKYENGTKLETPITFEIVAVNK